MGVPFIPADTSKEDYTVDHGGNLALIGPDGRLRGFVRAPLRTEKLAEQLPAGAPMAHPLFPVLWPPASS